MLEIFVRLRNGQTAFSVKIKFSYGDPKPLFSWLLQANFEAMDGTKNETWTSGHIATKSDKQWAETF